MHDNEVPLKEANLHEDNAKQMV